MQVRDVIKRLERDGWVHVRTTGSHRHYKHEAKPGIVTVPGHPSDDLAPGTLKGIWKQAGLKDNR
jgi:predicted RNA binding protein YcfA (HicA-like mRNA interferase family)